MLRPRIICSLLLDNGDLVKTKSFEDGIYIGDPLNTIRIFNEMKVDEIMIMDINAYSESSINFTLLEKIASVSLMPICYGGGIRNIKQIEHLLSFGIEKISLNSILFEDKNFHIFQDAIKFFGSQSISICVDIKKIDGKYYSCNKNFEKQIDLENHLRNLQLYNPGEIIIHSIDREGHMNGYDETLIDSIIKYIEVPLTILGGASSIDDIIKLSKNYKISGYSCGSIFCFKQKRGTVLLNYFKNIDKQKLAKIF